MADRIEEKEAARLRKALEERGVDKAAAAELAEALRTRLAGRTRAELEALVDGIELGCEVQRVIARAQTGVASSARSGAASQGTSSGTSSATSSATSSEMERLFEDFAVEIKKLDEGLRALAAYANRLRKRSEDDSSETIH